MSGGHFEYAQDTLSDQLFGWHFQPAYGLGEKNHRHDYAENQQIARKLNPMEDKVLSCLVADVLELVASLDFYKSCDTGEETYLQDVAFFKDKWLKNLIKTEVEIIDASINDLREELHKAVGANSDAQANSGGSEI